MPDRLNRGVFHMSYEIFHMTYEIFSLCLTGHLLQHSRTRENLTVTGLLAIARKESVLLQDENGERFLLSLADELAGEVELLRKNQEFLSYLDSCKSEAATVSLDEVEKRLR